MDSTLIVKDFQFSRDFRRIKWGATLWYNLLRAFCAGLILGVLIFFFPPSEADRFTAIVAPLSWAVAYLIIFLPLGVVFSVLRDLPFVKPLAAFCSLVAVAIGDPILCVLYRFFPKIIPVESPSFFSLNLVFWVLDEPEPSPAE